MKIAEGLKIIENGWIKKPKGFRVSFQRQTDSGMEAGLSPPADAAPLNSDVTAWRYAWKLWQATQAAGQAGARARGLSFALTHIAHLGVITGLHLHPAVSDQVQPAVADMGPDRPVVRNPTGNPGSQRLYRRRGLPAGRNDVTVCLIEGPLQENRRIRPLVSVKCAAQAVDEGGARPLPTCMQSSVRTLLRESVAALPELCGDGSRRNERQPKRSPQYRLHLRR